MEIYFITIVLISTVLLITIQGRKYTDDYCWRDYDGSVPEDALEGGKDSNGRSLYIGQVLYQGKIIPGKIYAGDEKVYFEFYDVEYKSNENIKILCTRDKNAFEWIPTQHTRLLNLLPYKTLIKGGFEPNCSTYLGRIQKPDGSYQVGKVICCQAAAHCYGLYTTNNGTGQLEFNFEVLAYNENSSNNGSSNVSTMQTTNRITIDPSNSIKEGCKRITVNMYYFKD